VDTVERFQGDGVFGRTSDHALLMQNGGFLSNSAVVRFAFAPRKRSRLVTQPDRFWTSCLLDEGNLFSAFCGRDCATNFGVFTRCGMARWVTRKSGLVAVYKVLDL